MNYSSNTAPLSLTTDWIASKCTWNRTDQMPGHKGLNTVFKNSNHSNIFSNHMKWKINNRRKSGKFKHKKNQIDQSTNVSKK